MSNLKKGLLFKPLDWGIKFEIILKIWMIALFSCLLMGAATCKLFETSLIHNEIRQLASYGDMLKLLLRRDPGFLKQKTLTDVHMTIRVIDYRQQITKGKAGLSPNKLNHLKRKNIYIEKQGTLFTNFLKLYMLFPLKPYNNSYLLISRDLTSLNQVLEKLRVIVLMITAITVVLIVILLNYMLKKTVVTPLKGITSDIEKIKKGKKSHIDGNFYSEYRYLVNNFNELLNIIDQQKLQLAKKIDELYKLNHTIYEYNKEMIKYEKLISIGELSAGIAHEIGNPLNNIQGYLSLLKRHPSISGHHEIFDYLRRIESDIGRIDRIIKGILEYSRKEASHNLVLASLSKVVDRALDLARLRLKDRKIAIVKLYHSDNDIKSYIDIQKFQQVFLNLINNAIDSIDEKGRGRGKIEIDMKKTTVLPQGQEKFFTEVMPHNPRAYILLSIRDNGSGINQKDLPHVFDPFFTTKEAGKGTGLGLSVSLQLIKEMEGTILIESRKGKGSLVQIILPSDDPNSS